MGVAKGGVARIGKEALTSRSDPEAGNGRTVASGEFRLEGGCGPPVGERRRWWRRPDATVHWESTFLRQRAEEDAHKADFQYRPKENDLGLQGWRDWSPGDFHTGLGGVAPALRRGSGTDSYIHIRIRRNLG
jgi:hypothetical protein